MGESQGYRRCAYCRERFEAFAPGQRFCSPEHRTLFTGTPPPKRTRSRSKLSTTARGYGADHQAERRRWEVLVAAGGVICSRPGCGKPIVPGTAWDLGHDDNDRSRYRGPEHVRCNRAAGARKGNRSRGRRQVPAPRATPGVTGLRW